MVKEAEAHAAEDTRFEEMATLRDNADSLVHSAHKIIADAGDKATDEEKQAIENATNDLEQALQVTEVDVAEAQIETLYALLNTISKRRCTGIEDRSLWRTLERCACPHPAHVQMQLNLDAVMSVQSSCAS